MQYQIANVLSLFFPLHFSDLLGHMPAFWRSWSFRQVNGLKSFFRSTRCTYHKMVAVAGTWFGIRQTLGSGNAMSKRITCAPLPRVLRNRLLGWRELLCINVMLQQLQGLVCIGNAFDPTLLLFFENCFFYVKFKWSGCCALVLVGGTGLTDCVWKQGFRRKRFWEDLLCLALASSQLRSMMSSLHEDRCSLQHFLTGQIQQLGQKEHVASETELKVSFFF